MKIYVIYKKLKKKELEDAVKNGDPIDENKTRVWAFTTSKKFAKEFMRVHSDKYFTAKKEKFGDEDYYEFLDKYRELELFRVELSDASQKIGVPMTDEEECEMETFYYDEILSTLPSIVENIPSCLIFKEKYGIALDALGISKSVVKARLRQTDEDSVGNSEYDLDGFGLGECGHTSYEMIPNTINTYVAAWGKLLREREK